jgi:predicted PolB exonuclease-like 3'-5' exonuclease
LAARNYFNRYTDDALDLCDALACFSPSGKITLHELSRIMGLPGKTGGIHGSDVEEFYTAGKIQEIADYCESDVINTYRLWLRYELFRGRLTEQQFEASEMCLVEHLAARGAKDLVAEHSASVAFSKPYETT